MVKRNLRLKAALVMAVSDARVVKVARERKSDIRTILIDNGQHFWACSEQAVAILQPVATAISHAEGDHVPLSVMPHIWGYASAQLSEPVLRYVASELTEIDQLIGFVEKRRDMNLRPVVCAAYALDPRFHGEILSDSNWERATKVIIAMGIEDGKQRQEIVTDLMEYRAKCGSVYGQNFAWEASILPPISENPAIWWQTIAAKRPMANVARNLLNMPASAAIVERCNKSYALQKTKLRNRLTSDRAAKISITGHNLKNRRKVESDASKNSPTDARKLNILSLPLTPPLRYLRTLEAGCAQNDMPGPSDPYHFEGCSDSDNEANDVEDGDTEYEDASEPGNDGEEVDNDDNEDDEDEALLGANVELIIGDWVAARFQPVPVNKASFSTKGKGRQLALMYIGQVDNICDDSTYKINFMKKQTTDVGYIWPEKEDSSNMARNDLVKLPEPITEMISLTRARLIFQKRQLENARTILGVPMNNVR
jgi:hypothetical protein